MGGPDRRAILCCDHLGRASGHFGGTGLALGHARRAACTCHRAGIPGLGFSLPAGAGSFPAGRPRAFALGLGAEWRLFRSCHAARGFGRPWAWAYSAFVGWPCLLSLNRYCLAKKLIGS